MASGVRESVSPEFADPRWSEDTGRLSREIVGAFRADGVAVTRRAFLEELRVRGGSVANANRSALYAYALAPELPAASELEDTMDRPDGFASLTEMLAATATAAESEA